MDEGRGRSTVGEVVSALPRKTAIAYSTVLTTLRILEKKGYVRHQKSGRAFVYQAVVDRGEARRSTIRYLVSRFFDGSHASLVLNVLEDEDLDAEELTRLRRLLKTAEPSRSGSAFPD